LYGDATKIPPGTLEGYEAPVLTIPGGWEYGVSVVRHWTDHLQELEDLIPRLRHIPTLLVWGSADVAVYARSAEELRKHFDHCEVTIFPGVGHLPYEETPGQFNTAVMNFLRE
jgi:pimeloyl-ACP methyl ester carboxylesterase